MTDQKKCKRATKKGIQCKYDALPGSEFCRRHQPREIWFPVVVTIFLSIFITFLITWHFSRESFESELSLRHISRPRMMPAVGGFPVVIADRITAIIHHPGFFSHNVKNSPFAYRINEDGAIKIYGEIRHTDGTVVVVATGDRLSLLPNTGLDINSDSRACEIVDSQKNPIYRISVIPFEQWNEGRSEIASKLRDSLN